MKLLRRHVIASFDRLPLIASKEAAAPRRAARASTTALILALIAGLFAIGPSAASAAVSFSAAPGSPFAAGTNPASVAIDDLSGDGKRDLAVAFGTGNAAVLLGNGDGSFQAPASFAAGTNPREVKVGDFNGDGKRDLATANSGSNNVSVLLGNGDGSFQAAVNFVVGTNAVSVSVADLNGDGKQDLATANEGSDNVSVLLGNGDGSFQAATSFAAGTYPRAVKVGDFNGDGKRDLATANQGSNNVSVLLGNGDGSFQAAVGFAAGATAMAVSISDFNGDGKQDLATANFNGADVSVLLGNGDGTFQAPVNFAVGVGPWQLDSGDLNGDGRQDIVASSNFGNTSGGTVSVLEGNGDGSFQAAVDFAVGGGNPLGVAIADLDGDLQQDIATANYGSNNASVLLNAGAGAVGLSPPALDFGSQATGSSSGPRAVSVTNSGSGFLRISSATLGGANAADFAIAADACSGRTLLVGESCQVSVAFSPGATGARAATLAIADDAPGSPHTVALSGAGTTPALSGTGTGTGPTAASCSLRVTTKYLFVGRSTRLAALVRCSGRLTAGVKVSVTGTRGVRAQTQTSDARGLVRFAVRARRRGTSATLSAPNATRVTLRSTRYPRLVSAYRGAAIVVGRRRANCKRVRISPKSLTVGRRTTMVVSVRIRRMAVVNAYVAFRGAGVRAAGTTNVKGVLKLRLRAHRAGTVVVTVPNLTSCKKLLRAG